MNLKNESINLKSETGAKTKKIQDLEVIISELQRKLSESQTKLNDSEKMLQQNKIELQMIIDQKVELEQKSKEDEIKIEGMYVRCIHTYVCIQTNNQTQN